MHYAPGPFLGGQEEHWKELVAERTELQRAVEDAGSGQVVTDMISLLQQTKVSHCTTCSTGIWRFQYYFVVKSSNHLSPLLKFAVIFLQLVTQLLSLNKAGLC